MKKLLIALLALTGLIGCTKESAYVDHPTDQTDPAQKPPQYDPEGAIVLGKKANVPYSIENMRRAFSRLASTRSDIDGGELQPNALYVRFRPADIDE